MQWKLLVHEYSKGPLVLLKPSIALEGDLSFLG